MICAITGATGFVGRALGQALRSQGHEVRAIPRNRDNPGEFEWAALAGSECVFHLAGEPVSQRWSAEVRRRIRDSRVLGSRALVRELSKLNPRPSTLVAASAVGYYGSRGDEELIETSAPGGGFLPEVCVEWERECAKAAGLGIRTVQLRIGIVLGDGGGALEKMLPPFRLGVGGPLGDGRQWMSWIQLQDLVQMFLWAASEKSVTGRVNAVAPQPVTNADFTRELAAAVRRPAFMPVPRFALQLLYGEMAEVLLGSQRVLPSAALKHGFQYQFPDLAAALAASIR